ncbi:MAG: TraR/DksA family transcriptional regulator, partial [Planctomycetota bacterium]
DVSLGMMDDENVILWQIDRAIQKIDTGSPVPYGICEHTKKPIAKNRIKLLPWTPLSIEGANYMDEENLTLQDMLEND